MTDHNLREIRDWHRISRDISDPHWQRVDFLLTEIACASLDDGVDQVVAALEDARDTIDDALDAFKPRPRIKRSAR